VVMKLDHHGNLLYISYQRDSTYAAFGMAAADLMCQIPSREVT
jgi:hypothetical protein